VAKAFSPNTYLFFRDIDSPFHMSSVRLNQPGSAYPIWVYSPDTLTFTEWPLTGEGSVNNLPMLSMEITDEDVIYDLTDFVNEVKLVTITGNNSPSISQILNAWTLSSNIVLDTKLRVNIITIEGETLNTYVKSSISLDE